MSSEFMHYMQFRRERRSGKDKRRIYDPSRERRSYSRETDKRCNDG